MNPASSTQTWALNPLAQETRASQLTEDQERQPAVRFQG